MKLFTNVVCCLLLAAFAASSSAISIAEFFKQLEKTGDVEDVGDMILPEDTDDNTILLPGDPDDKLDEDFLTDALASGTTNEDCREKFRRRNNRKYYQRQYHRRHEAVARFNTLKVNAGPDVEDVGDMILPEDTDDNTILLPGDPDDELDEDFLTDALASGKTNEDCREKFRRRNNRKYYQRQYHRRREAVARFNTLKVNAGPDVEDVGDMILPEDTDDNTILLPGDPDDELDEDFLTDALASGKTNEDCREKFRRRNNRKYYQRQYHRRHEAVARFNTLKVNAGPASESVDEYEIEDQPNILRLGPNSPAYMWWRNRRTLVRPGGSTTTRCVRKNIIMNLDTAKQITHSFCLTVTPVSKTVYRLKLVQDQHVLYNNLVQMLGSDKRFCVQQHSAPTKTVCFDVRHLDSSLCTSIIANFWANYKIGVDFDCMELYNKMKK